MKIYKQKKKPFEVNNNSKITFFYMDTKETIYWNMTKFKLASNSIPYL